MTRLRAHRPDCRRPVYLLAYDDVTGKPFLQPRALSLGLAGGLLAELMFVGAIWVDADRIALTMRGRPADVLGRHVLGVLLAEPERYPVRDWLMFLAASSAQDVGWRLEQAGHLSPIRSRRRKEARS